MTILHLDRMLRSDAVGVRMLHARLANLFETANTQGHCALGKQIFGGRGISPLTPYGFTVGARSWSCLRFRTGPGTPHVYAVARRYVRAYSIHKSIIPIGRLGNGGFGPGTQARPGGTNNQAHPAPTRTHPPHMPITAQPQQHHAGSSRTIHATG